jgi:hypothetical protein
MHAAETYARGYTGQDIVIGVVDFNFNLSSPEIRFDPASRGAVDAYIAMYEAQWGEVEGSPHGTAVAAVAAAIKNDSGIHGVAFNATVLAVDYFSGVNLRTSGGYHISDPWTYLTSRGVRVINTSFGYDEEELESSALFATQGGVVTYAANDQYGIEDPYLAVQRGALLVTSAGNDGDPDPALSTLDTLNELTSRGLLNGPGGYIIAGASDRNDQIASFSDRAGSARDHYLVAPGDRIVGPWGSELAIISGTSFSAPMISGAAALVMQRWPSLTAHEVADILFETATDLGVPGTDGIYGRGLLNIVAAMEPVGRTSIAVAGGPGPEAGQTGLMLGSAFGDGGDFRSNLSGVLLFDGFGRDFSVDLSPALETTSDFSLRLYMAQKRAWRSVAYGFGGNSLALQMHAPDPSTGHPFMEWSPQAAEWQRAGFSSAPEMAEAPRTVIRFSGRTETFSWSLGHGLSLADAVAPSSHFASASLTRPFATLLSTPGSYATVTTSLSQNTDLSFGVAQSRTEAFPDAMPALAQVSSTEAAVLSVAHQDGGMNISLAFTGLFEDKAVLASVSSGGLALADGAMTLGVSLGIEAEFAPRWFLKAAALGAATDPQTAERSLVTAFEPIASTSFALGLAREAILQDYDRLSFTFGQPLRAEHAPVTLIGGRTFDSTTGSIFMAETHTSLVPSGRELSAELAYRAAWGTWNVDAGFAYSMNTGHVAGRNDARAMLFLSRPF